MPVLNKDGIARIKIIQPGQGSSGVYTPEVLKRDGPKVFTKGLHSYIDHQTAHEESARPEGSIRDLAGVLESDAKWQDNGPSGAGLYADLKVFKPFRPLVEELAPHIGMSIRAFGKFAEGLHDGKKAKVVERLIAAKSIDMVTRAGAGGRFEELLESARNETAQILTESAGLTGSTTAALSRQTTEGDPMTEAQETALREATAKADRSEQQNEKLRKRLLISDAKESAQTILKDVALPPAAKLRVIEAALSTIPEKDGELDGTVFKTRVEEAVKSEAEYLSSVTGSPVRGMGAITEAEKPKPEDEEKKMIEAFIRMGDTPEVAKVAASWRAA